jgi:hypothetical protein
VFADGIGCVCYSHTVAVDCIDYSVGDFDMYIAVDGLVDHFADAVDSADCFDSGLASLAGDFYGDFAD